MKSQTRTEYDPAIKQLVKDLIKVRKGQMLSQKDLAAKMKTLPSVISRIELFHHHPKIETLQAYAAALDVKIVFHLFAVSPDKKD